MKLKMILFAMLIQNGMMSAQEAKKPDQKILRAIDSGNIQKVNSAIKENPSYLNQAIEFWGTPLIFAVNKDFLAAVESLVKSGADVNGRDTEGRTPLMWCPMDVGPFRGCGRNQKTPQRKRQESERCDTKLARLKKNRERILIFLLKSGVDIAAVDNQGRTALHYAARMDDLDMVKFLLKNGANPHARDKRGMTPASETAPEGTASGYDAGRIKKILKHSL